MKKKGDIKFHIFSIFIFFILNRCTGIYLSSDRADILTKLNEVMDTVITSIIVNPFYLFVDKISLSIGFTGLLIFEIYYVYYLFDRNNYLIGKEHGSAEWGGYKDIKHLINKTHENNIILTKTESLNLNTRKTFRNNNVLVIGGTGSGKTRFFLKPQLLQKHTSYVVTDPKGTILLQCGNMLKKGENIYTLKPQYETFTVFTKILTLMLKEEKYQKFYANKFIKKYLIHNSLKSNLLDFLITKKLFINNKKFANKYFDKIEKGYRIKVFNTVDFKKSMHYNPFEYIHCEEDILKLIDTLILNTKCSDDKSSDDFWVKAEKLLYQALIGYIYYERPKNEQNFSTLILLLDSIQVKEDNECFKSPIDIIFDKLEVDKPDHFAVRQYKKYKQAAGKTAKSILISCGARLSPFDIKAVREVTDYDELELDTIGDEKTALFIIVSDTSPTYNFLVSILYTQLFNVLCEKADNTYKGSLPVHVRFLLDEFANIGQIPNFEKLISTIRSREISANVIIQSMSQLKSIYKDNACTIEENCDTTLFLGGKGSTLKSISESIGKTTIDHRSVNQSKGQKGNYSLNEQIIGRELITASEISLLGTDECLLQIRGVKPFKSKKYDITKHKRYKFLSDFNSNYEFQYFIKNDNILNDVKEVICYEEYEKKEDIDKQQIFSEINSLIS